MSKKEEVSPTAAQMKELFKLGAAYYKLAPWKVLDEATNIGIEDPETGLVGYLSVMGALGEHHAIAFYLGNEGFHGLLNLRFAMGPPTRREILEIPQIQISFEGRDNLEPEDLAAIRKYQLMKPRGRNSNITFRSVRPGYHPWFIDTQEAALLIVYLREMLELMPEIMASPEKYELQFNKIGNREIPFCLVRKADKTADGLVWKNSWKNVPEPDLEREVPVPQNIVRAVKKKQAGQAVEITYFEYPSLLESGDGRPFEPQAMLVVGTKDLLIYAHHLAEPCATAADYYATRIEKVMESIGKLDFRPEKIVVDSGELYYRLKEFCEKCGIDIALEDDLPAVESVIEYFLDNVDEWADEEDPPMAMQA